MSPVLPNQIGLLAALGVWLGPVGLASASTCHAAPPRAAALRTSAPARRAPEFTLPDVDGRRHSLAEYRGRPLALFFFCGCEPCHRCARAWGQIQRDGLPVLAARANGGLTPLTLVVFLGDAAGARDFAAAVGLDLSQTVLLTDPASGVALSYNALPCPRVFVMDRLGALRYTNTRRDDAATDASAATIACRARDALAPTGGHPPGSARPPARASGKPRKRQKVWTQ